MASQTRSTQLLPSSLEDRGPPLRAFAIVLVVITTLATALRFWSRSLNTARLKRSRFWWDDRFAAASAVAALTELSLCWILPLRQKSGGTGPLFGHCLILLFCAEIMFNFSLFLAKTSALRIL
ncbi:hypothetical protein F5Y09DRAFT_163154 [Xylaria sp. FL1042]|nr:hypothetical protein F5Y09DRAFT_163154 [Xylaria sp. FL1042]